MKSVMIDIETLGLKPGCAILSIGAIVFDPFIPLDSQSGAGLGDTFHMFIKPTAAMTEGLQVESETLGWWLESDATFLPYCQNEGSNTYNALVSFSNWLQQAKVSNVWAKDPSFDCAVIDAAAKKILGHTIIPFKQERSVRTVIALGTELGLVAPPRRFGLARHNALHDAIAQAEEVSYILNAIKDYKSLAFPQL